MKIEEYYKLGFEEASRREAFFKKCSEHLDHAREKHPFFAERVIVRDTELANEYLAGMHKRDIKRNGFALEDILESEIHEFLVEAHRGNLDRAAEEACDIVAVLMRFIFGDIKKEPKQ
jgi:hypothetical protein